MEYEYGYTDIVFFSPVPDPEKVRPHTVRDDRSHKPVEHLRIEEE
mgnify:CR=1 FL=1